MACIRLMGVVSLLSPATCTLFLGFVETFVDAAIDDAMLQPLLPLPLLAALCPALTFALFVLIAQRNRRQPQQASTGLVQTIDTITSHSLSLFCSLAITCNHLQSLVITCSNTGTNSCSNVPDSKIQCTFAPVLLHRSEIPCGR